MAKIVKPGRYRVKVLYNENSAAHPNLKEVLCAGDIVILDVIDVLMNHGRLVAMYIRYGDMENTNVAHIDSLEVLDTKKVIPKEMIESLPDGCFLRTHDD